VKDKRLSGLFYDKQKEKAGVDCISHPVERLIEGREEGKVV
jgi:hypothetical protein